MEVVRCREDGPATPPLSKVVVVEQILLFKGHFDLKIGPICLRKMTKIHEIVKLELKS